ncbi:MAG: T9SS type A sorting domain-containing protein [Candidatus Marinamargulisbacteria bacterium]
MFSKRLIYYLIILLFSCPGIGSVVLERYSISTYINSAADDPTPSQLSNIESSEENYLHVVRVGFRQYSNPYINSSSSLTLDNRLTLMDNLSTQVDGEILFFPNPFRLSTGSIISYRLNEPANVRIEIYNMFGQKIYTVFKNAGMDGGKLGGNKLSLNAASFNYFDVSSGVYFLFLFDEQNKLIGKSKFVIIP